MGNPVLGSSASKREPNPRGEGDHLRADLVAAASELLLTTQSVALPSLRAVARACSVSPAAVYLHFDSQKALVAAVIQAQTRALRDAMSEAVEREPVERKGEAFAGAYVRWGLEHPGAYQLLFESADQLGLDHEDDDEGWDLMQDAARLLVQVEGVSEDESLVLAHRIWVGIHGIVSLRLHKPDEPWPTTLDDDVAVTLRSLLATAGKRG